MAQAYPPDNALTMQGAPPPAAPKPAPFPYDVRLQADGSSVYFLKGSDVILAVNKIPKVAPALQPPPQQPMA